MTGDLSQDDRTGSLATPLGKDVLVLSRFEGAQPSELFLNNGITDIAVADELSNDVAVLVGRGAGEAPEELILRDRTLLSLTLAWTALFLAGIYVGR